MTNPENRNMTVNPNEKAPKDHLVLYAELRPYMEMQATKYEQRLALPDLKPNEKLDSIYKFTITKKMLDDSEVSRQAVLQEVSSEAFTQKWGAFDSSIFDNAWGVADSYASGKTKRPGAGTL